MNNVFLFLLQFGNNNNYMNMADANGALLAGGDVSIWLRITFIFPWMVNHCAMSNFILESLNSHFQCLTIYCFKTKSIHLACLPLYVQMK